MNIHRLENSAAGSGGVTREMVHARVAERVLREGRSIRSATMSDFAQAKRELSGEPELEFGGGD
jgi:hypothetical protein